MPATDEGHGSREMCADTANGSFECHDGRVCLVAAGVGDLEAATEPEDKDQSRNYHESGTAVSIHFEIHLAAFRLNEYSPPSLTDR